jgi:hypothetical protein
MSEAKERVFSSLSGLQAGSHQTGNGGAERTLGAASSVLDLEVCSDQRERAVEMTPAAGAGLSTCVRKESSNDGRRTATEGT